MVPGTIMQIWGSGDEAISLRAMVSITVSSSQCHCLPWGCRQYDHDSLTVQLGWQSYHLGSPQKCPAFYSVVLIWGTFYLDPEVPRRCWN